MLSNPTASPAVLARPRTTSASSAPAMPAVGVRVGLSRKAPFSPELTGVLCPQRGDQRHDAAPVQFVNPVMGAVEGYLAGAQIPATGLPRGAPV